MDRFQGFDADVFNVEEIAEQEALEEAVNQLQIEQRQWEGERDTIAEYESWFFHKTIMEADAEEIAERRGGK